MFTPAATKPQPATGGASSSLSGQIWNGTGTSAGVNGGVNGNSTTGLQLPSKSGLLGAGTATPLKGSAPSTPARQGSAEPEAGDKPRTDVDSLMDAVGASGVDIDAEEEALRLANEKLHQASIPSGPAVDRSRKQDFIDPNVLAECVKKIAAAFQLRTLEPDTIPLIALATRHRLMALINAAIETRDHRINSSHLRPPPLSSSHKRHRSSNSEEDSDFDEEEEEEDRRRRKGKGKEVEAGWDQIIYDDQEKILSVLEKVEREEERKKRKERMIRDAKELEEKELAEAIAASEAADAELGNTGGSALDNLVMGSVGTPKSGTSTPRGTELGKDGKPKKEKKKKKEGPGNYSEVVKKKMTDQVAMRSIGGRSFTWATAGGSGFGSPTPGGMATPTGLPKPKFSSGLSGLPAPNFGTPLANQTLSKLPFATSNGTFNPLARLSNVPHLHEANRSEIEKAEWERGKSVVELEDIVFALERERGMGVGKGTGRNALIKSKAGIRAKQL